MESPGVSRIRREMAAFAAGEAPESEVSPESEAAPEPAEERPSMLVAAEAEEPIAAETEESEPVGASEVGPEVVEGEEGVVTEPVVASETMEREASVENAADEDDGLLSTDEISGEYSAACIRPAKICNSMTVVPLGANTIEIGHSGCVFFPCGLCIGPTADGEVRTRDPGTNAFRHWETKENVMTFSADGTATGGYKKRPGSQKRTFQKVETRDLAGKWCGLRFVPFVPCWPLSFMLCTTKKALDEDAYEESGICRYTSIENQELCCVLVLCLPIPVSDTGSGKRNRVYVNGHPTNGFHLESGEFHWYRNPGWAMDESDPMATVCAKKIS